MLQLTIRLRIRISFSNCSSPLLLALYHIHMLELMPTKCAAFLALACFVVAFVVFVVINASVCLLLCGLCLCVCVCACVSFAFVCVRRVCFCVLLCGGVSVCDSV